MDVPGFMPLPPVSPRPGGVSIKREPPACQKAPAALRPSPAGARPPLSPAQWKVIEFMQKEFRENGQAPSVRKLNKSGVVSTKELYELFPGGPAKKAAKIAGLKKPEGCV
jgi:TusE/DsrC/DsvC family sulfur relay protein